MSCTISYITQRRERTQSKCLRSYSSVQHTTFSAAESMSGSLRGLHVDRRVTNRRDRDVCRLAAITRVRSRPLINGEHASSSSQALPTIAHRNDVCEREVLIRDFEVKSILVSNAARPFSQYYL